MNEIGFNIWDRQIDKVRASTDGVHGFIRMVVYDKLQTPIREIISHKIKYKLEKAIEKRI